MYLLIYILLGGFAGWVTGRVMKGDGYGIIVDVLLGLAGGWLGSSVLGWFGIYLTGYIGYVVIAVVGGVLIVSIARLFK